ncbi:MAG: radical SAM family heme chaperone HemW [Desulfovibrio sp.]|nr:MAG: radical SAM family heme chaperone HemW [Desulfovibrio sp.]
MLLYIHVPFCRSKCRYCAFHSMVASDAALVLYVDHLVKEIQARAKDREFAALETLYMGGGTPSLLSPLQLERIVGAVVEHFSLGPNLEFTMEGNPGSLRQKGYLQAIRRAGVNRLSIGMQSLDNDQLKLLGRTHTASQALSAYNRARSAGFANISLDLIWGLPQTRVKDWLDQLKRVVKLGPEHISCYGLTVEPDTPLEEQCLDNQVTLPLEGEQAKMFVHGAELLESEGYLHYEVANFARMGYLSRHNLGYWEGSDYLGLGPSAVSTLGGERFANPPDLDEWMAGVAGGNPWPEPETLDAGTTLREMLMLRLRTSRGLRLRDYRLRTERDFMADFAKIIETLHHNHLIRIRDGYLRLTKEGMLVSNTIIENIFAQLDLLGTDTASSPANHDK